MDISASPQDATRGFILVDTSGNCSDDVFSADISVISAAK